MQKIASFIHARDQKTLYTRSALIALMVPLILEQLLSAMIGVADTFMVSGSSAGEAAVSAISLVDTLNVLLIQIFAALATGGAVVVSQYLGAGDKASAKSASHQLVHISLLLGLGVGLICLVLRNPLLDALFGNSEALVLQCCQQYFMLSVLSYPFLALYNACASLFRSMNDSRTPLYCSIVMNVANILGNALLIYGFHLGVIGAGLASLISRVCGALYMLFKLQSPRFALRLDHPFSLRLERRMVSRILRIGVPSSLENSLFHVGKVLVSRLTTTFPTYALAANAIGWTLAGFICIPLNALSLGLLTVAGNCMGAKNPEGAKYYTVRLLGVTQLGTLLLSAFVFLFIPWISTLFNLTPDSQAMLIRIMRPYTIAAATVGPAAFVLTSTLRAAGDVRFPMVLSILSMWIFRIGFAFLFCLGFGMDLMGVWYATFLDWLCRAILFTWRTVSCRWERFKVI